MVIYIPTILYKYIITVCDPILQEYYITVTYKGTIYKGIYKVKMVEAHEQENGSGTDRERIGKGDSNSRITTLPLCHYDF